MRGCADTDTILLGVGNLKSTSTQTSAFPASLQALTAQCSPFHHAAGALVTMCGAGNVDAYERAKPYMELYSKQVKLMGGPGSGQHTKGVNQIMIASSMIGTVEALLYGHRAGLDLSEVLTLLSQGGAASFTMSKLGPRMLQRDFEPGFYVEHFVKDLGIVLEEARGMNLSLPGTALASQFYIAYMAQGGARNGTQVLLTVFEKLNNMKVRKYNL